MDRLLEDSRDRLLQPLGETRRTYLIIFNLINALLTISFMLIGKATLGQYVVSNPLIYLYVASIIISLITAAHNLLKIYKFKFQSLSLLSIILNNERLDKLLTYASVVCILLMSVGGITGFGNPSSDALITNFAFAHSMIVAIVIIIGRKAAFGWGLFVLIALFYNMFTLGWNYEYHYLTPTEVKVYKQALINGDKKALDRQAELEKNKLHPPSAVRYFRLWFTFIMVSLLMAYTFGGILIKTYNVIPSVISNIEESIQKSLKTSVELEHKRNEVNNSAIRIARYKEAIEKVNYEIEKMDYSEKKKFNPVLKILKDSFYQEELESKEQTLMANLETIHPGFWKGIQELYQNLSPNELIHLVYLKMNMNNTEIAIKLNVTIESLRSMRYKLKKKLNISDNIDLKTFIDSI